MPHQGSDFHTVRVVCKQCGWCRKVAHSGCSGGKRALLLVERSKDPTHVLYAKVVEVPEDLPVAEALATHSGYRDLAAEVLAKGLHQIQDELFPLFVDQACPRCKTAGRLELDHLWNFESLSRSLPGA